LVLLIPTNINGQHDDFLEYP